MANHPDYEEMDMIAGADYAGLVTTEALYKEGPAVTELSKRYVDKLVDEAFPDPTVWQRICSFFK